MRHGAVLGPRLQWRHHGGNRRRRCLATSRQSGNCAQDCNCENTAHKIVIVKIPITVKVINTDNGQGCKHLSTFCFILLTICTTCISESLPCQLYCILLIFHAFYRNVYLLQYIPTQNTVAGRSNKISTCSDTLKLTRLSTIT